jgi:hypothetical protein
LTRHGEYFLKARTDFEIANLGEMKTSGLNVWARHRIVLKEMEASWRQLSKDPFA